ncbi:MAG: hypothetical protein R3D85_11430 [Paracoccaceae bacterium]
MRRAQIVSGLVYVVFFLLLSPLFPDLEKGSGVAAVITVSGAVAAILPVALAVAAMGSQMSASVADSLGNVGLIGELTHGKVDARHAFVLVGVVGIGVLVAADVNQVIALASRAFALFYAMQCLVAGRRRGSAPRTGCAVGGFWRWRWSRRRSSSSARLRAGRGRAERPP